MSLNTLAAGLSWYDKLVEKIPEGQLFSWRAVFDAIPDLIEHLPTTLGLTVAGALFGLLLALLSSKLWAVDLFNFAVGCIDNFLFVIDNWDIGDTHCQTSKS